MGSLNRWIGIGNLGRDAELRYTQGGDAVANFSIACTDTWKSRDGGKKERTEWVRVVLWGKAAEAVGQYLTKGKQVCVEGRLETRKWEDRDGNKRETTEVKADRVVLLGGSGQGGSRRRNDHVSDEEIASEPVETETEPEPVAPLGEDDIPF